MGRRRFHPSSLNLYIGLLSAAVIILLGSTFSRAELLHGDVFSWIVLTAIFAMAEYAVTVFHYQSGRQGLSASEAILVPMIVALSFGQTVWGVGVGTALVALAYRRLGWQKGLFNVGQYVAAAAVAAWIWHSLREPATVLTPRNALVAVLAVLIFAVLTHVFVAGAISLAERRSFRQLSREVAPALGWNLAGNLTLGLLFAASYLASHWTVLVFVLPLAGLYLGYRAVLRQEREKERVENLYAASRALASSHEFGDALRGFLGAMKEIASSSEGTAILNVNRQWLICRIRDAGADTDMEPLVEGPFLSLVERFRSDPRAIVIGQDQPGDRSLLDVVGAQSLVAVPLVNGAEYLGCLLAIDRLGAEEFSDSDARLLEALGNELVLTLDSYRLFAQVTEERERFQQIFDGSKEGICLLDEDGVIRAWNPALARITGFEEKHVIGEKWSERVLVRDRYHRRVEGMDIVTVPADEELELVTRQGPPRWVAIMSGEVPAEDKKSWVLLVRDITALHELEESKSDFLATISHELRTPLTTIKGSLQVLSRPNASADSEIGKQMVEIMKRGSDRLERLVMNLLAVSQMEAGDVQVYPEEVPLEEVVRDRVASILPDHPQVEIEIEDKVSVRADRERLAQAVEHLLDNARKFGPESGRIRIEVTKHNGYARLSISDEGPGIPKIDQERIFERFVRLGHVLTRDTQGPGVGLFIVKKSIEAMGGSVQVESEPGHGTTFHLRVPLAHPMAAVDTAS